MISSTGNAYVKKLRGLASGSGSELFIAEGENQIAELRSGWRIENIIVSESYYMSNPAVMGFSYGEVIVLKDHVFESISGTVTPRGIIAVCEKRRSRPDIDFDKPDGLYVVCDRVSDPGNMGTIIRNAHAFGCDCLLISSDSVDVYNPKTVRSGAGSLFCTPFAQDSPTREYISLLKSHGIRIVTTQLRADKPISDIDFTRKTAVVIGNESCGVSHIAAEASDELAWIPMPGGAESLNAAVASGIVLYEAVRQRLGRV